YMDTISLYQAGFKNVVASMGTSLTQEQARLIKRYTDTVLISYDGDTAGQKANMRGLDILKEAGINVRVVPLPDGLDPDDVIKQRGNEGYQKCLDSAMPLIDYKISVLRKSFDLSKTEDKRKYVSEAIKIIRTSESAAEQEDLLKHLRDETGVTFEALKRELLQLPKTAEKPKETLPVRQDLSSMQKKASRFVIAAFLFGAGYTQDYDILDIPFDDDVHVIIARYVASKRMLQERIQIREFFDVFEESSSEFEELSKILDYGDGNRLFEPFAEKYFSDCIMQLRLNEIDKQIEQINLEIKNSSNVTERTALASGLVNLLKQKEKIKNGDIK
ncbi:MAG: toprim domain-containing protein, partial [Clostridia bacterium]|nr:toprim domain-containing protein [Clostridia bacterium]